MLQVPRATWTSSIPRESLSWELGAARGWAGARREAAVLCNPLSQSRFLLAQVPFPLPTARGAAGPPGEGDEWLPLLSPPCPHSLTWDSTFLPAELVRAVREQVGTLPVGHDPDPAGCRGHGDAARAGWCGTCLGHPKLGGRQESQRWSLGDPEPVVCQDVGNFLLFPSTWLLPS